MTTKRFAWQISGGQIALDDLDAADDADLLSRINRVTKKLRAGDAGDTPEVRRELGNVLRPIEFEFDFDNLDAPASEVFEDPAPIHLELDASNSWIEPDLLHDELIVTIHVIFEVVVRPDLTDDEIDAWLDENGGPYAGFASGGWSYDGDLGQELYVA